MADESLTLRAVSPDAGRETGDASTGMTRRSLLGVGGLLGVSGLLGASSAVDTASAQSNGDVYLPNATVGGVVEVAPNDDGSRLVFGDESSDSDLLHLDTDSDAVVFPDSEPWFRGSALNDVGAIDNSALTGGDRLESLVGTDTYIENGELRVSGGGGDGGDLTEKLETIADPPATTVVETGGHGDNAFHGANGWGPVFGVQDDAHWRGAYVDADEAATVEFAVYEMSDDPFAVDSADPYRTREFQIDTGVQFVPLEIYLEPGLYHVCQRSGTPLRRVDTDTDWSSLNETDAPIELLFGSWHYNRNPGMNGDEVVDAIRSGNEGDVLGDVNDDFAQIFEEGWDSILHYMADWDVGHH